MPRRRTREAIAPSAEINVTSLVDVALTLLVIFIITAPLMQGGVEVGIPKAQTESVPNEDGVTVTVDAEGRIFIGEAPVSWAEFPAQFPAIVRERNASSVYLRGDSAVDYGTVVRVLGAMKEADVASVGLIAQPEPEPR